MMWTMSDEEYEDINHRLDKLAALEAGGVDNWEGYEEAMRAFLPARKQEAG